MEPYFPRPLFPGESSISTGYSESPKRKHPEPISEDLNDPSLVEGEKRYRKEQPESVSLTSAIRILAQEQGVATSSPPQQDEQQKEEWVTKTLGLISLKENKLTWLVMVNDHQGQKVTVKVDALLFAARSDVFRKEILKPMKKYVFDLTEYAEEDIKTTEDFFRTGKEIDAQDAWRLFHLAQALQSKSLQTACSEKLVLSLQSLDPTSAEDREQALILFQSPIAENDPLLKAALTAFLNQFIAAEKRD